MSGSETLVGLVLGVFPLLISVVEHYEDVFRPIARYRKFVPEVRQFRQLLGIQKAIFRNECRLLLEKLTSHDVAEKMLKERDHPSWRDSFMDSSLTQRLGDSKDAFLSIIGLIEDKLKDIERRCEGIDVNAGQASQVKSVGGHSGRRQEVKNKLKFSFSEPWINQSLAYLKERNNDLLTISSQIRGCTFTDITQTVQPKRGGDMEEHQVIQIASRQLYEALQRACTVHTKHSVHFCLKAERVSPKPHQVRFNMALTHLSLGDSVTPGDPIWLTIESMANDSTTVNNVLQTATDIALPVLTNTLKRQNENHLNAARAKKLKPKKKSVRFTDSAFLGGSEALPGPSPNPMAGLTPDPSLPDLCIRRNFCIQIRECSRESFHGGNMCVGFLEKTQTCKHLVYLSPPAVSKQPISLAQLVSSISKRGSVEGLPLLERLQLAKLLAVAVLQYHATPWMRGSWRSEDVLFFNVDEASLQNPSALPAPHLNVQVETQRGQLDYRPAFSDNSFVPNPLLFGFGIVLLELAHKTTLRNMYQACDMDSGRENQHTEFFAAKRISKTVGSVLGGVYAKIVRKCLACDFGCGDDLTDPALQKVFYRDVVCELGKLEEAFNNLQLGI